MTSQPQVIHVIHPDGRKETHPFNPEGNLNTLQKAVGGYIEYLNPAYHALQNHDVVINEEGLGVLPENWPGSRAIGMDLSACRPLSGPVCIVPHDPEDGPSPAEVRGMQARGETLLDVWLRALDNDPAALKQLGLTSAEQITVIDASVTPKKYLYLLHPDGLVERHASQNPEQDYEWVYRKLGPAYRFPRELFSVRAFEVLYAQATDHTTAPHNPGVSKALGFDRAARLGTVILYPTGQADPSAEHERLSRALQGDEDMLQELGLKLAW